MSRSFRYLVPALVAGLAAAAWSQPYLRRLLTLREPDVEDYRALPFRAVAPAPGAAPLPEARDPDWVTRVPLVAGDLKIARGDSLDAFLRAHGTTAFVLLHEGRVVDERYYQGYGRDSLFKAFSMSKSVLSALVGVAEAEGALRITDPLGRHVGLPDNPALAAVTLEQLADNVSGLRYRRGNWPWREQPRMYYTTDARGYVSRSRVVRAPGTRFEAEELSPLLLAHALERALRRRDPGMTLSRYTEQKLWRPMGARYGARWVIDRAGDGLEKTESGFVARAVDLARFGQLYLDGGRADGRQVVPAAWVEASTTPPAPGAPNGFEDGFHRRLWWGHPRPGQRRPDFYANGHFGQRIYVSPYKRLVLVRLGNDSAGRNWTGILAGIAERWPAPETVLLRTSVPPCEVCRPLLVPG